MSTESLFNPLQTMIVTARSGGFDNATTLSWHTPLSMNPYLYGVVLRPSRKIYEMIMESKAFCVNFLPADMEKTAIFCGTKSGHTIDKFKEGGIGREECTSINCPRIKGCCAYLECRLVETVKAGDHYFLIGEVVHDEKGIAAPRLFQDNMSGPFTFTTTKK